MTKLCNLLAYVCLVIMVISLVAMAHSVIKSGGDLAIRLGALEIRERLPQHSHTGIYGNISQAWY